MKGVCEYSPILVEKQPENEVTQQHVQFNGMYMRHESMVCSATQSGSSCVQQSSKAAVSSGDDHLCMKGF
jgi:hypothetical protein